MRKAPLPLTVLGLMSGTSLDGIDGAIIVTDGMHIKEYGPALTIPYTFEFRQKMQQVLGKKANSPLLNDLENTLTKLHADVVQKLQSMWENPLELIGFHGQTIFHAPPTTWQIGDGPLLAQLCQCPVVYDFRTDDVNAGGQGAPLVPIYHQALVEGIAGPSIILNIGGVANGTAIGYPMGLLAGDTGPGGALVDDWVQQHTGQTYDQGGNFALRGQVNENMVQAWLALPFFHQSWPKSLDRLSFAHVMKEVNSLSIEDGAATLTEFTVQSILKSLQQLPFPPLQVYVSGGGRHNNYLMRRLRALLPAYIGFGPIEALGCNGDFVEAQAFAYLAVRRFYNLPISFPLTTGVNLPICGGRYVEY